MSDQRIQPALSPEEWARGGLRRGDWEEGPGTDEEGRPCLWAEGGATCWWLDEQEAAKMAALCLHGRITWEMVDALRLGCTITCDHNESVLFAIADLIESLLPPRTTVERP